MRVVAGLIGAALGTIIGVVIGLLAAILTTHNELFGILFIGMCTVPAGVLLGSIIGGIAGSRLFYFSGEATGRGRIRTQQVVVLSSATIGSAAILMGLLVWTIRIGMMPPSDQRLLSNFDKHEATFVTLIEMLKTDRDLIRVDENWTEPKDPKTIGVSPARIAKYRQMLGGGRVARGFQADILVHDVDFYYWMIGSAISSDTIKGYAYRTRPPMEVLNSLDGFRPDPKNADETIKVYRHIRGNWYLFFEYIPG
jgi:hypothetical protein